MNPGARKEALEKISSLFGLQKLGVLSTSGKNGPYANLIAFAAADDLKAILFATPEETVKFENMKTDSRVALLVENSKNHVDDFQKALAVTALGRVEVLRGEARSLMIGKYLNKHSNLKDFVNSEGCALMKVNVDAYILVESLGKATRISMKD
jgi:nitroimidazol reductase NimA-like FMN-containing flavoprotein (pyridoxamine 5'-phosphate oxidase superfamily)